MTLRALSDLLLPAAHAWASAIAFGVACTALAHRVLVRRLARVGAVSASTVTFLIPVFAASWGRASSARA